ncbi:hypothetical protein BJY21_001377 [Kineosphaera limosa]|uniref:DUF5063 domain-containing protein n=1 Tax=Kineosphaera limosa NBRC 100340 TaxID=1184609 RepID=K6WX49_9MICO|nr:DUF5063 domain-containing protein [Kineosphaera limosa]NYE00193.1 hypothetical protein [Kineosphaera limosa]GAB98376.1 hypothetical protein KILIM_140_00040 [Kineosphaera limosa NBRC 100340]
MPELPGMPEEAEVIDNDLAHLADETANEARAFLVLVRQVAAGDSPDIAIPMLLLAVSQVLVTGARLGAISDVVPTERFEPDLGSDEDVEGLRNDLAQLLAGLDEYVEIVDPLTTTEVGGGMVSGDIADIAAALLHGLRHHAQGQISEALWWWQFSYLSSWGGHAASALRVLQSVISHIRLDADEDVVAEAQFDALHGA